MKWRAFPAGNYRTVANGLLPSTGSKHRRSRSPKTSRRQDLPILFSGGIPLDNGRHAVPVITRGTPRPDELREPGIKDRCGGVPIEAPVAVDVHKVCQDGNSPSNN